MNSTRILITAGALVLGGQMASAQDLSRYRGYALESSLGAVLAASGARATDVKTLHERPALIQQLEWRAPYIGSGGPLADPVRAIEFTFMDDVLYQVIVHYDRDRTEGLSSMDIVEAVAEEYGAPVLASTRATADPVAEKGPGDLVLARWDGVESRLTLIREPHRSQFRLTLLQTSLSALAWPAIEESMRQDVLEAPRREAERRMQDADAASAEREKARIANKAAFRP